MVGLAVIHFGGRQGHSLIVVAVPVYSTEGAYLAPQATRRQILGIGDSRLSGQESGGPRFSLDIFLSRRRFTNVAK